MSMRTLQETTDALEAIAGDLFDRVPVGRRDQYGATWKEAWGGHLASDAVLSAFIDGIALTADSIIDDIDLFTDQLFDEDMAGLVRAAVLAGAARVLAITWMASSQTPGDAE